jgi:DNA-directed RNA polymerase specialized sigma24 family protein
VKAVLADLRRRGLATDEALDLTAEVFATALLASRRYRPGEAPARAWLMGIARNKLAHRRRRAAIETAARRKLGMPRLTYSDEALERVDELLDAEPSLYTNGTADLPPAERQVVVARVIEACRDRIAATCARGAGGRRPPSGPRIGDRAARRADRRRRLQDRRVSVS